MSVEFPARNKVTQGQPSFSLRSRIYRAVWIVAWQILCRWTPPAMNGWRCLVLRAFGAQLARGARVYSSARVWAPIHLQMSDGAVLGPRVNCYCQDRVVLGRESIVSQDAQLLTGTHDIDSSAFELRTRPIAIGDHAWIAAAAIVGPGVLVSDGAVLGAGAVAFSDLDSWSVYVGNPCRKIRDRRRS